MDSSDKYCSGGSPELHGSHVGDPATGVARGTGNEEKLLKEKAFLHGSDD